MNTFNNNIKPTGTEEKNPFEELVTFIAKRTSQNDGIQNWMVYNAKQANVADVTPLIRFAQSASLHLRADNTLNFEFTDMDNKVHQRDLTEAETAKLKDILSNAEITDDKRQFKLTQFFTGTSASILAHQTYSEMMSQGWDFSNTLHR